MTNEAAPLESHRYRLDIDGALPLASLIEARLDVLGATKAELARRMGCATTVEKGIRRIEALLKADLKQYTNLRGPLAKGLALDESVLDAAVADTRYMLWARNDRQYRRDFKPHVIWDTALRIPRPITIAGLVGANRLLYYYPDSPRPQDWSEQAVANRPRGIPCYGVVDGFWVNYSPDCAVSFTNEGVPEEVFGQSVRPGFPSASFGSRPTNWAEVTAHRSESLGDA